jgi:hypothetical protein
VEETRAKSGSETSNYVGKGIQVRESNTFKCLEGEGLIAGSQDTEGRVFREQCQNW